MILPHRRRRGWMIAAAVLVVALAVSGGLLVGQLAHPGAGEEAGSPPPATTPAVSAPLTSSLRAPGTIGFDDTRDLVTSLPGVLTGLPTPGTIVTPGHELYRINNQPVILFRGELPAWRDFGAGMEDGPDVRQLEQSLSDLGLFDGSIDEEFTGATARAIRAWQKNLGLEPDGAIPYGRVIFSPTDIRVGETRTRIGADVEPGTVLYTASAATPIISASIPTAERDNVAVGDAAQIALPGGEQLTGRIASIGSPQEKDDASGKKQLLIPLTIVADDPGAVAALAPLTVQLTFSRATTDTVLQVPVGALLAVGNGTFAVEVYRDGTATEVAVETGRFASGMVEITGGDLNAGDEVVIPG